MTDGYNFAGRLVLQGFAWSGRSDLNRRPPEPHSGVRAFSPRARERGPDPPRVGERPRGDCVRGAHSAPRRILWGDMLPMTPRFSPVLLKNMDISGQRGAPMTSRIRREVR